MKDKYPYGTRKNSNVLEMKNTNSFHMKLKHEEHYNANQIELN
jgi:hypothetical protein